MADAHPSDVAAAAPSQAATAAAVAAAAVVAAAETTLDDDFGSLVSSSSSSFQCSRFVPTSTPVHSVAALPATRSNGKRSTIVGACSAVRARHSNSDAFAARRIDFQLPKAFVAVHRLQLDSRLVALLILFAVVISAYKMVYVTMHNANTDSLLEVSTYVQAKFRDGLRWAYARDLRSTLSSPIVCGLALALFSFMMVYLDSNVPGVSPPSPLSPSKKQLYRQQKRASKQLGYITALAVGAVVTVVMYCDF